jgi:1,4-dihydroxy-2-naphthoyl-CoA hydrolase
MPQPFPSSIEEFAAIGADRMPGHLGIVVTELTRERIGLSMPVTPQLLNPVGVLHGGAVVTLADTACGYGTVVNLPDGGRAFTTIELKTNFLGSVTEGTLTCVATPLHLGRTTQVWDAEVSHQESGRRVAMFRCTNLVIRQT